MIDLARLAAVASKHLGPEFGVGVADPSAPSPPLLPAERAATAGMIDKRRREFAAGRAAARQAMVAIGYPPAAVPMQSDRAPLWPKGLVGSITHSSQAALAVVASTKTVRAVGIDLEEATPLTQDLWDIVLTSSEQASIPDGATAKRIFSAKEAVYKAQFPITGRPLEFTDLTIRFEGSRILTNTHHPSVQPLLNAVHGQTLTLDNGLFLSLVSIAYL